MVDFINIFNNNDSVVEKFPLLSYYLGLIKVLWFCLASLPSTSCTDARFHPGIKPALVLPEHKMLQPAVKAEAKAWIHFTSKL